MLRQASLPALLIALAAGPACIIEKVCVDGYTRVSGRCVPVDAGTTTDGSADASESDGCALIPYYRDEDEDTFGDDADTMSACTPPEGYVERSGDCDDTADTIHPEGTESCNQTDDDCDVAVDEGLLEPVGEPLSLGTADGAGEVVALDSYELGYVAVWLNASGELQYGLLTTIGVELMSPTPVATSLDGSGQHEPYVRVVRAGGAEHAVVAWTEASTRIRARVMPLDGRAPLPPVLLEEDTTELVTVGKVTIRELGGRAAVAWVNDAAEAVHAATIDPTTGMIETGVQTLYDYTMNQQAFARPMWTAVSSDTIVLGTIDQALGDTAPTGYLTAFTPTMTPVGATVRVRPDPTQAVLTLHAEPDPSGEVTLAATLSAGTEMTQFYHASLGIEGDVVLSEDADPRPSSGLIRGSAGVPGGLIVSHATVAGAAGTRDLWVSELLRTPTGGSRSVLIDSADYYTGAAVARHAAGGSAVLYGAYTTASDESEVFFQFLGCE